MLWGHGRSATTSLTRCDGQSRVPRNVHGSPYVNLSVLHMGVADRSFLGEAKKLCGQLIPPFSAFGDADRLYYDPTDTPLVAQPQFVNIPHEKNPRSPKMLITQTYRHATMPITDERCSQCLNLLPLQVRHLHYDASHRGNMLEPITQAE